jgi:hypothetical protein
MAGLGVAELPPKSKMRWSKPPLRALGVAETTPKSLGGGSVTLFGLRVGSATLQGQREK